MLSAIKNPKSQKFENGWDPRLPCEASFEPRIAEMPGEISRDPHRDFPEWPRPFISPILGNSRQMVKFSSHYRLYFLTAFFPPCNPLEQRIKHVVHFIGIIPARYGSTRFPGKPLAPIAGKPLIQHVVERCRQAKSLAVVIVATDDQRIRQVAEHFCRVEMTAPTHPSGSDRVAEVAGRCNCDGAVNIQEDEPLIDPAVIDAVAEALVQNEMSTAATPIRKPEEYENPNVVKV